MTKEARRLLGAAILCASAASAWAGPLVLDFEGTTSNTAVGDFYAASGVQFGANARALNEADERANFRNAPSPGSVMFFDSGGSAIVNVAGGFGQALTLSYSTTSYEAFVRVWSGENATGELLGTISLAALGGGDDADDPYNVWTVASLSFDGIARSIDFGGTANRVGFDDITLGAAAAPGGSSGSVEVTMPVVDLPIFSGPDAAATPVPETPTLALALAALAALGLARRRAG